MIARDISSMTLAKKKFNPALTSALIKLVGFSRFVEKARVSEKVVKLLKRFVTEVIPQLPHPSLVTKQLKSLLEKKAFNSKYPTALSLL